LKENNLTELHLKMHVLTRRKHAPSRLVSLYLVFQLEYNVDDVINPLTPNDIYMTISFYQHMHFYCD